MGQVSVKVSIPVAADKVWQTLRDFGAMNTWAPGIATLALKGNGVGAVRTMTFQDGSRVVERLESLNDASRSISYTILESTLPLEGYVASLTVRDLGSTGCEVEWFSTFGAKGAAEEDVSRLLALGYRRSLAGLQKSLKA
uniref:SRPBCC family protein n=1 Tax=Desulfobacca acetoxidans TaxID=60893 RepID=A0A7V6A1R8_9BACT